MCNENAMSTQTSTAEGEWLKVIPTGTLGNQGKRCADHHLTASKVSIDRLTSGYWSAALGCRRALVWWCPWHWRGLRTPDEPFPFGWTNSGRSVQQSQNSIIEGRRWSDGVTGTRTLLLYDAAGRRRRRTDDGVVHASGQSRSRGRRAQTRWKLCTSRDDAKVVLSRDDVGPQLNRSTIRSDDVTVSRRVARGARVNNKKRTRRNRW